MASTWALVPIKRFAVAKSRLEGVLTRAECTTLAAHMARDVLRALGAAPDITGIAILTNEPDLAALSEAATARLIPEAADGDYCATLGAAAAELGRAGARHLLVLPADLPTLSAGDIQGLLAAHTAAPPHQVTICSATRDGGTNALVLTPPTALPFLFGPDSARRHLLAATSRGLAARQLELPAFARDIDTPDDVDWLLGQRIACATGAWLKASGVTDRLKQKMKATAP